MAGATLLHSRKLIAFLSSVVALSLIFPSAILADSRPAPLERQDSATSRSLDTGPEYAPGEVLVKVSSLNTLNITGDKISSVSPQMALAITCLQFGSVTQVLPGVYKLTAAEGANLDVAAAVEALQATEDVSYAEPNYIYRASVAPNDEHYVQGQQWAIPQIKSEQAWDITTGSPDLVIAVLDTGVATDHPDLQDKIVPGRDFVNNDEEPYDDQGHGTHVGGVAAASTNNGIGVAGISWGARIMPVKVLNAEGAGLSTSIATAIRWATDNGARIINASFGGVGESTTLREAVRYAHDRNVLVVAAAGNTPSGRPSYPAAYDTVLAVGATDRNDTGTGFSSWGPYVDVTAPGVGILGPMWDEGELAYGYGNGTSFSSPIVAGVASLVLSVNPGLNVAHVKQIIEDSTDDLGPQGFDENYGWGRVNAFKAVQMAQKGPPAARTPTPPAQATRPAAPPTATTPPIPVTPTLQLDSAEVSPGSLLAILGSGFAPNELVDLMLTTSDNNTRSIGNAQANVQGSFRAEAALPMVVILGKATLTATGANSGIKASVEMSISVKPGLGQSSVRGVVRGADPSRVTVSLKPSIGVIGPEVTVRPNAAGVYTFSNLVSGVYVLSASASGSLPVGPITVQLDGTATDVKTIDMTITTTRPKAFDRVAPVPNTSTLVYFPEVGHTLRGPFLKFWQANGGLAIFGYPLSEEFSEVSATDGKSYTVQYFERNRFEHHPEFAGTRSEVLMGLLGVEMTRGRTFRPGTPILNSASKVFFQETQHSLSGPFLAYWQRYGGLPVFGYPISEEMVENGYTVQYFERNRFEHHPEFAGTRNEVLLGLLGVEIVRRNGWMAP